MKKSIFLMLMLGTSILFGQTTYFQQAQSGAAKCQLLLDATVPQSYIVAKDTVNLNYAGIVASANGTPELSMQVTDINTGSEIKVRPSFIFFTMDNATGIEFQGSGNIRATSLHNNASANGDATEQDIRSGSDVSAPTVACIANCSTATSATNWKYMRVGNEVMGSFMVTIDPINPSTPTTVSFTLPLNSDLVYVSDCSGSAMCGSINTGQGEVTADVTNDVGLINFISCGAVSRTYTVNVMFTVK